MIIAVALAAVVATVPPADDPMAPYVGAAEAAFQEAVGAPLTDVECDVEPIGLGASCLGVREDGTDIVGDTPIGPDGEYHFAAGAWDELRSGNDAAETALAGAVRECAALPDSDPDGYSDLSSYDFELLDGGHSVTIERAEALTCLAARVGLPQWLPTFIGQSDAGAPTTMTFGNFTVTWVNPENDGLNAAIYDTEVAPG
jgi:hypothetical protein